MIKKLGDFFADKFSKIMPDSFIFAILLTIVAIILAVTMAGSTFQDIMKGWVGGFLSSEILMFAMFLIMGLTFGYCIGFSPPFKKIFAFVVGFIHRPWQAYLAITLLSLTLTLINWGLAPVLALLVVEICKKVKGIDYRIVFTATYAGMLPWHGGLSASAPLMMATEETAKAYIEAGVIDKVIPITETLLIPLNYALVAACFIVLPIIILLLAPKNVDERWDAALQWEKKEKQAARTAASPEAAARKQTLADRLNGSPVISIVLALLCLFGFIGVMKAKGFNLPALVFVMLALALLLNWRPINFINSVKDGIKGSADIVIQFPLYGAIMGLVTTTGLAVLMAKGMMSFATAETLPFYSFLTSTVINIFIPSGGGEWLAVGMPLLQAAKMVGADFGKTIIGFSFGDALTNLINPFWTLAYLPIMGRLLDIRPRDIMGYAAFICIIFFVIETTILLLV